MSLSSTNHSIHLIARLLDSDTATEPILDFGPQKPAIPTGRSAFPLTQTIPERQGVPSRHIARFLKELSEEPSLRMHSVLVIRNGQILSRAAFGMRDTETPRMTFSACKSVTALAIGLLIVLANRSVAITAALPNLAEVAAGFLRRWLFPFLPDVLAVILTGLMELTNGIFAAQSLPRQMQFVLCSLFCSFGGVSVLLQIAGLSKGLWMGQCIAQKALHGLLTALLSLLYLRAGAWSLLLIPAVLFAKIAVEIPKTMVYNVRRKEGI